MMDPNEQPGQMIDPMNCMGELAEALMRALMFARAALVKLQQRYRELQQQHEELGEAFDARGVELEQLRAALSQERQIRVDDEAAFNNGPAEAITPVEARGFRGAPLDCAPLPMQTQRVSDPPRPTTAEA